MLRDVFYFGDKPNVHPRERYAQSLEDARNQCTTEHFWIINEFCDYTDFDWDFEFEFLPDEDVWAEDHNNIWPSIYQKDSGTWLCSSQPSDIRIYRSDVSPIKRKNIKNDCWVITGNIDETKFDFGWHPDPTDPPFIYKWGCKFFPVELKSVLEYRVPGATQIKYMDTIVELLPDRDKIREIQKIDRDKWDITWQPSPLDPPYIYIWGNKYIDGRLISTLEYHAEGATEKKYMPELLAVLPEWERWHEHSPVDKSKFDFSWRPDPREPDYIYVWGNKYEPAEIKPTLEYRVPNATEIKYMTNDVPLLPQWDRWKILHKVDMNSFDFSWRPDPLEPPFIYVFGNDQYPGTVMPTLEYHVPGATDIKYINDVVVKLAPAPENFQHLEDASGINYAWVPDPTSPPYIYVWGNQWNKAEDKASIIYEVPGATEYKYMEEKSRKAPSTKNWQIPDYIDVDSFDFSWEPNPHDPPYIYEFGTQWQKTGGPRYVVEGATEIKYVDIQRAKAKPRLNDTGWQFAYKVDLSSFDFSWHPDNTEQPYIYLFGCDRYPVESMPVIKYEVPGATEIKYVLDLQVKLAPDISKFIVPENLDVTEFDFSWVPDPHDPPYIYEFGTQWQKTGGPRYVVEGATEIKYVEGSKAKTRPNFDNWVKMPGLVIESFDYSWHPDSTEEPYIYVFGNQYYSAEKMPTIEYRVGSATEIKYVNNIVAKLGSDKTKWQIPDNLDVTEFDFSWVPDPSDPAYIYQFGTQWQKTGGPRYVVEGATEVKYVDTQKVTKESTPDEFKVFDNLVIESFDYSWHPDSTEEPYIYVFGNQHYPAEKMPTIEYRVDGATEIKYVNDITAKLGPDKTKWQIPDNIDDTTFDFSWIPDPCDPPYIYEFGTQWQKTGGPRHVVEGATEIKYVDIQKAIRLPDKKYFVDVSEYGVADFDYSWHPDSTEEPYIYVFGNKYFPAEKMPTIEYRVKGATEKKYINELNHTCKLKPRLELFKHHEECDLPDYGWIPDPDSPPYIYAWGNQWNKAEDKISVSYTVEGATEYKYMEERAIRKPSLDNWQLPLNIDKTSFDFSWEPNPHDPPYVYEFGTQWQKTGGPRYVVEGTAEIKYVDILQCKLLPSLDNWQVDKNIDVKTFDFSWHPDSNSPPYIYQFGTPLDREDGPRYVTPGNNGEVVYLERVHLDESDIINVSSYQIDTTLEDLINQHPDEVFWATRKNINYENFDFEWRPEIVDVAWEDFVHVFGSPDSEITQTYFVNAKAYLSGNTQFKFVEDKELTDEYMSGLFVQPDLFFVDKGNKEAGSRFSALKTKFGDKIQKTRFLNSWVDTISRCVNRSSTDLCWILNSELDYSTFNFDYYPNPWQMKMVHVFGTQWSHWGSTFIVNRENFSEDTKYIKIIEHLSNLNFVKNRKAQATNNLYNIILVDHGNKNIESVKSLLELKAQDKRVSVVPFNESYLQTFKDIFSTLTGRKEEAVWICSSVCDYSNFDFSYICDPFAKENLHVFPSDKQKFGDTFLLDINKTKDIIDSLELLQQYEKVNYNQHQRVKRLSSPVFTHDHDTHVSAIDNDFDFPYAVFQSETFDYKDEEPMNLWTKEDKTILITSTGGTRIVVPREARSYIKKELYDYPYIKTQSKLLDSKPLDIVFLSNGEKYADDNYEHLLSVTHGLKNRVVRVDGVNGRVQAYHAALEASHTPWAFTIFAKLFVSKRFDWGWQPDRLQEAKHYIFHAKNPVNDLEYGHQAAIAYNKKLVLANKGGGLDFTLDDLHETVPMLSGIANFNLDPFSTWRTAFREAIKLNYDETEIGKKRLETWLNVGKGDYADWSIKGANDGVRYCQEVNNDISKLKLSYEWATLKDIFNTYNTNQKDK